jgi:hypothetical protein
LLAHRSTVFETAAIAHWLALPYLTRVPRRLRLQLTLGFSFASFQDAEQIGVGMAQPKIPRRVEYLRAVIDQLGQVPRSELNEDTDTSFLETVVRQRIEHLSNAEAKETLRADRKALANWLRKPGNEDSPAHFILGWMMASAPAFLGMENSVTSIVEMVAGLPPMPPGRTFDAVPSIDRVESDLLADDGNVFLYVSHSAFTPPVIDIRVTVDGVVAVRDSFEHDRYSKFTRYQLQLSTGRHRLTAISVCGQASIEETITVSDQLHVSVAYWYSEPSRFSAESAPCFTLHAEEKAWIPDHGWKEPP